MKHAAVRLLAFALIALSPMAVLAETWEVDRARSSIVFDYAENGEVRSGEFESYDVALNANASDLTATSANVVIQVQGLDMGDPMRQGVLMQPPWFDAEGHPEAIFSLEGLVPVDEASGRFNAKGVMTIKGKEKPYIVPMSLQLSDGLARAEGSFTMNRLDFRLRDAVVEAFVDIGKEITIRFDLTAARR